MPTKYLKYWCPVIQLTTPQPVYNTVTKIKCRICDSQTLVLYPEKKCIDYTENYDLFLPNTGPSTVNDFEKVSSTAKLY